MEVIVYNTAEEIGEAIGKIFVDTVNARHNSVLGLATGASPIPTYDHIARAYEEGKVSLKDVTTFNLDEYCDLPREDKNSFYSFMVENLFSRTDIDMNKVHFLNGNAEDVEAECARYDSAIDAAGGIDLQILGIGTDGHIGFNEPADHFSEKSFRIKLEQSTIDSNQKYFGDVPMPRYAVTMGTNVILKAKRIVLVATGDAKAEAIKKMIQGPVDPQCPASALQNHPDTVIFLDKGAAKLL